MGWGELGKSTLDNALYDVQYGQGFTAEENNQIKNLKYINKVHTNLTKMGEEEAYKKFSALDTGTQDILKQFYGDDATYSNAPKSGWNKVMDVAGGLISNFNPFAWGLKAIEEYTQAINTIPNVFMMATENNADAWDIDTWSKAYNEQESLYNNALDKELTQKYGKEYAFIAKKSLEGMTPGEILGARGKINDEFVTAFESYLNDAQTWDNGILEDYRQAKLSAGRSLARNILGKRDGAGDPDDTSFTLISGLGDAVVSILTDPLTYFTFGAGKGVTFLGKIALNEQAKIFQTAMNKGAKEVFKFKKVSQYWDDYGTKLKDLKAAREAGEAGKAAEIVQQIKTYHSGHGRDADIDLFISNNVFDAKSAENFFEQSLNATKLVAGRTADTTYFRTSVATVQRHNSVTNLFRRKWAELGSTKYSTIEKDTVAKNAYDEIKNLGTDFDSFKNIQTPALKDLAKQQDTFIGKVVKSFSYLPGDESIITGANAAQTLERVKMQANLIMPKDIANGVGEMFLRATQEERIVIMRGLDRAVMESMGLDKAPAGRELIEKVLTNKYGAMGAGMATTKNVMARDGITVSEDALKLNGGIHDYQLTEALGPLPWQELIKTANDIKFTTGGKGSRWPLFSTIGGALNGTLASKLNDVWSFWTLMPRLGIRSAIDEGFMFFLSAPRRALFEALPGLGNASDAGKALTAFTGDVSAVGPISNTARKITQKLTFGKFGVFDFAGSISLAERHKIYRDIITKNGGVVPENVSIMYAEALGLRALEIAKLAGTKAGDDLLDLLRMGISDIGAAQSSVARATGTGAAVDATLRVNFKEPTALLRANTEMNVKFGDSYELVSPQQFDDLQRSLIQYNNMMFRLSGSYAGKMNLGRVFVKHNGLGNQTDFDNAITEVLNYLRTNPKELEKFITKRASTVQLRNIYKNDIDIAKVQLESIFVDMGHAVHGSRNGFNKALIDDMNQRSGIVGPNAVEGGLDDNKKWINFIRDYDFDTYKGLVKDHLFEDQVYTNIIKMDAYDGSAKAFYSAFGDKMWEMQDRIVTGLVRQDAVTSYYFANRNAYRALEQKRVKELMASNKKLSPELAESIARQQFAELSMKNAIENTLKFVDNPHIRTNIAASARNISRFYRATEDFMRRVYRLKDVSSEALYRARLLHSGLAGTGILDEDEYGEEYFVIPMDNILHAALDPALRVLSGGDSGFVQPQFQRFGVKLTALNPSFQDDAGIPYLSGPSAALGVLALKNIIGNFGEPGQRFAESMDNVLLGDLGDNLDLRKALMPAMLNKAWTALDQNAKAQTNVTATLSAIAYLQANAKPLPKGWEAMGREQRLELLKTGQFGIPADATGEERRVILDNVRISGHNLVAIRSFLGIVSPFSPFTMETTDLPDYIRETGTMSLRQEYFDILDTVFKKYGADVSDPYELAAAMFVGQNPNKLVYTVSKEEKATKALLRKTNEVQDWIMGNKDFINAYGDAAYFFAPQHGEINLSMYTWMRAAELYDNVDVEEYLTRTQTVVAKNRYFAIGDRLELELKNAFTYEERSRLIRKAEEERDKLKRANPLLETALGAGGYSVEPEELILNSMREIAYYADSPITAEQREKLQTALTIFDRGYAYIKETPGVDELRYPSTAKRIMRDKVLEDLFNISDNDAYLRQIVTGVLQPILKFYSRDSNSASLPIII